MRQAAYLATCIRTYVFITAQIWSPPQTFPNLPALAQRRMAHQPSR